MSESNNNNNNSVNNSDNENNLNQRVNSFLQNITNSVYNNNFLDVDNSNTFFNETFIANTSQDTIEPINDESLPRVRPPSPPSPPPPPPSNIPPPPPPPRNTPAIGAIGILPLNHPNIGGTSGNRFLLRPTRIRFSDILPNGAYGSRRYINITPNMVSPVNENNILNNVIQYSFNNDKSAFKQIISDEGKKMLKPVPFSSLHTEETKCSIMQETFESDSIVIELPCKHVFCQDAIMHWLENESATCPICRTSLPSNEIRVEKNINNDVFENSDDNEEIENNVIEENSNSTQRERSSSAPLPLENYISEHYRTLISNITRIRDLTEEEDTQRAIWNSIATS